MVIIRSQARIFEEKNIYGENSSVLANVRSLLVSYTVPVDKTFNVEGWNGSGDGDGEFFLVVDGVDKSYGRTSSSARTLELTFVNGAIFVETGKNIKLEVLHREKEVVGFKGQIFGNLVGV